MVREIDRNVFLIQTVSEYIFGTTVESRYLEVVGTIFYKFILPEVQIILHFG